MFIEKIKQITKKIIFERDSRLKVNLFIVGEQKCGTTSFHQFLRMHKGFINSRLGKEVNYFNSDRYNQNDHLFYEKSYRYDIRFKSNPKYLIDSSTNYGFSELALQRIAAYNPNARIIFIERNPVDRFFSAYKFYKYVVSNYKYKIPKTEYDKKVRKWMDENPNFDINAFFNKETSKDPVFLALRKGEFQKTKDLILSYFQESNVLFLNFENITTPSIFQGVIIPACSKFLDLELDVNIEFPSENSSGFYENLKIPYIKEYLEEYYKQNP